MSFSREEKLALAAVMLAGIIGIAIMLYSMGIIEFSGSKGMTGAVTGTNLPPEFTAPSTKFVTKQNVPVLMNLGDMFKDPEGAPITFLTTQTEGLVIDLKEDKLTITPVPGFIGERIVTVFASDGEQIARKQLKIEVQGYTVTQQAEPEPEAPQTETPPAQETPAPQTETPAQEPVPAATASEATIPPAETQQIPANQRLQAQDIPPLPEPAFKIDPELESALETKERMEAIVVLNTTFQTSYAAATKEERLDQIRANVRSARDPFLEKIKQNTTGFHTADSNQSTEVIRTYDTVSVVAVNLTKEGIEALRNDSSIRQVVMSRAVHAYLNESVPLVHSPDVWNMSISNTNLNGINETVCITDTGIYYGHYFFSNWNERIVGGYDFINQDNQPVDDNGHGTHCSGIVGGNSTLYKGVAPYVKIVPVKVLDAGGFGSDISFIAGIDYCSNNSAAFNISVLSASLGFGGQFTSADCPTGGYAAGVETALSTAVSVGIIPVIATGNNGYNAGVSYSACSQYVLSVGSTNKTNAISSYSNYGGDRFDVFAPGESITSSWPGNTTAVLSGTSMATPHVAGMVSILQQNQHLQGKPSLTLTQVHALLNTTGLNISSWRRIDVYDAIVQQNYNFSINQSANSITNLTANSTVQFGNDTDLTQFMSCGKLSKNYVQVDSVNCPQYNKGAHIVFGNLTGVYRTVLRDSQPCSPAICQNITFTNGVLNFDVTGFSSYSSTEGNVFLLLTKTDNPDPAYVNTILSYQIVVNVTMGNASNITITDLYPDKLIYLSSQPEPVTLTNDTFVAGNLTENQTFAVNISVFIGNISNGTVINNSVNISFQNDTSAWITAGVNESTTILNTPLWNFTNISVIKSDSIDPVNASAFLNYTINVTVSGNGTAWNLTVNDTYPALVIYQSSQPNPVSGTNNTWLLGSVPNGTSILVNITVFTRNASNGTVINNTVNVTFVNDSYQVTSFFAFNETNISSPYNRTNLSVVKLRSPGVINASSSFNYTINITNIGTAMLYNVAANDTYPVPLSFIDAQPNPDGGTNNFWTIGTMAPGASIVINVSMSVPNLANGVMLNNSVNVTFQNDMGDSNTVVATDQSPVNNPPASCPVTINASTVLSQNIASTGTCITFGGNNIVLDCAGKQILYGSGGGTGTQGIVAESRSNITIKNCAIVDTSGGGDYGIGINFTGVTSSRINNTLINTTGNDYNHGIYLFALSNNNIIANTSVSTNGARYNYGIFINQNSGNNTVSNTLIRTNGTGVENKGVYIYSTSSGNSVINNTIITNGTNNNDGIQVYSYSNNNWLENNTIILDASNYAYGVQVQTYSQNTTVRGNNITINPPDKYMQNTAGIYLQDSATKTTVDKNSVLMSTYGQAQYADNGIFLYNYAQNNTITNNRIDTSGSYDYHWGILLYSYSSNNLIENNTILTLGRNYNYGIVTRGPYSYSSCNNNTIKNNTILANGTAGINYGIYQLEYNNNNNILNNKIVTNCTYNCYGIYFETSGSNAMIANNTIITSGSPGATSNYGIWMNTGSNNNVIADNNISTTGQYSHGIYLVGSSNETLHNNNITIPAQAQGLYIDTDASTPDISQLLHSIDIQNTINGTPIYYYRDDGISPACPNNQVVSPAASHVDFIGCNNATLNGFSAFEPITIVNSSNSTVNNSLIRNTYAGVRLFFNSAYNTISNSNITCENTSQINYGIMVYHGSSNNTIKNNNISSTGISSGDYGIHVYNSSRENNITNNFIFVNGSNSNNYGIYLQKRSSKNTVENSNIRIRTTLNTNYGIYIYDGSEGNIIRNSTINVNFTTGGSGIAMDTYASNNTVTGCTIRDWTNYGVYVNSNSQNNTISYNNILGNNTGTSSNPAIRIDTYSSNSQVIGNNISNNCSQVCYGMYLYNNVQNSIIANNTIRTTGSNYNNHGIFFNYECNNNNISGNNIYAMLAQGIRLQSLSQGCRFNDNNITTTGDYPIRIESSTGSVFNRTILDNSTYWIYSDSTGNLFQNTTFGTALGSVTILPLIQLNVTSFDINQINTGVNMTFINSTALPFFNTSGLVTITGLSGGIATPRVSYGDTGAYVDCPADTCAQQSFRNGVFVFNVTHFTSYAANTSAGPILSCPATINTSTTLTQDLSSNDNCITIGNNSITLDCGGYAVSYNANGGNNEYGIFAANRSNITITNCNIIDRNDTGQDSYGIYFINASNSTIRGNTITTNGTQYNYGILLYNLSSQNNITNNRITTNGTNQDNGIRLDTNSNTNMVANNTITAVYGYGIELSYVTGSNISNNTIQTLGTLGGRGISVTSSNHTTVSGNSINTQDGEGVSSDNSLRTNITSNIINAGNSRGIQAGQSGLMPEVMARIQYNSITAGLVGIYVYEYTNNTIIDRNNITSGGVGIWLYSNSPVPRAAPSFTNATNNIITTTGSSAYGIEADYNARYNLFVNTTITTTGTGSYGIYTNKANNSFANTIINATAWMSISSGDQENVTNTTFIDQAGVINIYPFMQINTTDITKAKLNISANKAFLNSSALPFFNTTGIITLYGIGYSSPKPQVDYADSGSYTDCPAGVCTALGYSQNNYYTYNVTHFTGYSSAEGSSSIASCPVTVNVSSTLSGDISSPGTCIIINASNVLLDCNGYTIGYGADGGNNEHGIDAGNFSGITITRCTIRGLNTTGSYRHAINLSYANSSSVSNNTIIANGTNYTAALFLYSSSNNTVAGNTLLAPGLNESNYGAYLGTDSSNNLVENNTVNVNCTGNDNTGIWLSGTSGNNSLNNNAINVTSMLNNSIGIYVQAGANSITGSSIIANTTFRGVKNYGIWAEHAPLKRVSGNTIKTGSWNLTSWGIYLDYSPANITGNTIFAAGNISSIGIELYESNATIANNNATALAMGSVAYGINLGYQSTARVANNTIIGLGDYGAIEGLKVASDYNVVENNNISTNGEYTYPSGTGSSNHAIEIVAGNSNNFTNNTITPYGYVTSHGIYNVNGKNNTFTNNTIRINTPWWTDGQQEGIVFAAHADGNIVQGNDISTYCPRYCYSINIYNSSNNTVRNNSLVADTMNTVIDSVYVNSDSANNTINSNRIRTTGGNAIYLAVGASQNALTNNTVILSQPAGANGIQLSSLCWNNIIANNTILQLDGTGASNGIYLTGASFYNFIDNNTITIFTGSSKGIYIETSSNNNNITNNLINVSGASSSNIAGISVSGSQGISIRNNRLRSNSSGQFYADGILFQNSGGIFASNNTILTNGSARNYGIIGSGGGDNSTFIDNNITTAGSDSYGIYLVDSQNDSFINNKINTTGDGLMVEGSSLSSFLTHEFATTNTVNGTPIYYYGGARSSPACPNNQVLTAPTWVQIDFMGCNNVTLNNYQTLESMAVVNASNMTIAGNRLLDSKFGLRIFLGTTAIVENNTINATNSTFQVLYGVWVYSAGNNTIRYNNISKQTIYTGETAQADIVVSLSNDAQNNITDNKIFSDCKYGVALGGSRRDLVARNNITATSPQGYCTGLTFSGAIENTVNNNTFNMGSDYLVPNQNKAVYLGYSYNNTFANNTISNPDTGIFIEYSANNTVDSNNINSQTDYGVDITYSNINIVKNNVINLTTTLAGSSTTRIYHSFNNTFANNTLFGLDPAGTGQHVGIYLDTAQNNTIENNTISTNGAGQNTGIFFAEFSYNNTLANNLISANSTFILDNYGIQIAASMDNIFRNNRVASNCSNALYLQYLPTNNIFTGNTFTSGAASAAVYISLGNGSLFSNNTLSVISPNPYWLYSAPGAMNNFTNTTFALSNGSIGILPRMEINATNITLANLNITYNRAYLNSTNLSFFNTSGTIILNGLSFAGPKPMVDYLDSGSYVDCPANVCTSLGYSGNTYKYNVTHFTGYSSAEGSTVITSCPVTINESTTLTQDLITSENKTCITMNSSNITLDCAGHTILYATNGTNLTQGVFAYKQNNLTVQNCVIMSVNSSLGYSAGINFTNVTTALIKNNTIVTNGTRDNHGFYALYSFNVTVINNTVTAGRTHENYAIIAVFSDRGLIANNTARSCCGNTAVGLYGQTNFTITNNAVNVTGASSSSGITVGNENWVENNTMEVHAQNVNSGIITSDRVTVRNNTIYINGTSDNIGVNANNRDIVVMNNITVIGTSYCYALSGDTGNRFENNTVRLFASGGSNAGVYDWYNNVIISNSIIMNGTDSNQGMRTRENTTVIGNSLIMFSVTDSNVIIYAYPDTTLQYNNFILNGSGTTNVGLDISYDDNFPTVIGNNVSVSGSDTTKGVYASTQTNITVINNNITVTATSANNYALQIDGSVAAANIEYNAITASGADQTYGIELNGGITSENNITGNNISITNAGFDSAALALTTTGTITGQNIINNNININASGGSGIFLGNATTNTLTGNNVTSTNGYAVFIAGGGSNSFENTSLTDPMNWMFAGSGTSGNTFVRTLFLQPSGSILVMPAVLIENDTNATKSNLYITYIFAFMNSTNLSALNTSAVITFESVPFTTPRVLVDYKDNISYLVCPSSQCHQIGSYTLGGPYAFNTTHFTAYTLDETPEGCPYTYTTSTTLGVDITCPATAIILNADNLVLDCNGHKVRYGGNTNNSQGVFATGRNNITVRNCNLLSINNTIGGEAGINFTNVNNSLIERNNITTNGTTQNYGIELGGHSTNNIVRNNNITANGTRNASNEENSYNYGIYIANFVDYNLYPNANNSITDNTILCAGDKEAHCIHVELSSNNTILHNNITGIGKINESVNTYGMFVQSSGNNISWNTITATGGDYNNGIYLIDSKYNSIIYNTINTSGNKTTGGSEPATYSYDYGILFWLGTHNHTTVYGNTITTNSEGGGNNHGIYFYRRSENMNISNNNITILGGASDSYGLYLYQNVLNSVFDSNRIKTIGSSGYMDGIYVYGDSGYNNFTNNVINTSGSDNNNGIHISGVYNVIDNFFTYNNITTSGIYSYGIRLENGAAGSNFNKTLLDNPDSWIYMDGNSYTSANFTNTTFQMPDGSINLPGTVENIEFVLDATKPKLNITPNLAFMNSSDLYQLNVTGIITLNGLAFTNPRAMVDYKDDGTYIACPVPSQCNPLGPYTGGIFVFNTTHFTGYKLEETPGVQYNFTNISVIKTDSPDPVNTSDYLNYTINVTVSGNGTAYNLTINETYPQQVIYISSQPSPVAGTNNSWVLGNLTATNITINITVLVQNISNNTLINNTANATCTNETGALLRAFDTENTTVLAPPVPITYNFSNMSIRKIDNPDPVNANSNLTYQINVSSTGNGTAYNVTVNDTYPPQAIYLTSRPTPVAGTNNSWLLGNLTAGTNISINITVLVLNISNGTTINNTANVTFQNETSTIILYGAFAETTVLNPPVFNYTNLTLTKKFTPEPVAPGGLLNYTLTVRSYGNGTAFNVTVNDTYPDQIIYLSSSPAPVAGTNNSWDLGNITPGSVLLINITVQVVYGLPDSTFINNTANLTYQNETSALLLGNASASTNVSNVTPIPPTPGGQSGGGGGGGGYSIIRNTTAPEQQPAECIESWSCEAWSQCTDNSQSRVCTDQNNCGTTQRMPATQQKCSSPAATLPESTAQPELPEKPAEQEMPAQTGQSRFSISGIATPIINLFKAYLWPLIFLLLAIIVVSVGYAIVTHRREGADLMPERMIQNDQLPEAEPALPVAVPKPSLPITKNDKKFYKHFDTKMASINKKLAKLNKSSKALEKTLGKK